MNLFQKLERKFGRYAIHNLSAVIIGLYAAGYILNVVSPALLRYLTLEPYLILRGQIWRVVTWVIVPPTSLTIFTVIMLFFYFSIGQTLERTWGAFRFNVYILTGMLFTVLGAFLLYAIFAAQGRNDYLGGLFNTYFINMSIFLAFAMSYPDMRVLLYFFIPVKMKWMGMLYGVMLIITFVQSTWVERVAIIASLLNFIIYFFLNNSFRSPAASLHKQIRRPQGTARTAGSNSSRGAGASASRKAAPIHRCAICGRTEQDSDQLVFRYCSKCDGAYEYCQDHLFNHEHKTAT